MKAFLILCICGLFVTQVVSLSCVSCSLVQCPALNCEGGTIMLGDECGCCDACAKQLDESCNGIWNLEGTCDKGLKCVYRKGTQVIIDPPGYPYQEGGKCEN